MRALAIITLLTIPLVALEPTELAIGIEVVGEELLYHAQAGETIDPDQRAAADAVSVHRWACAGGVSGWTWPSHLADVPLSIQAEMRHEGKPVITMMPPCPANPLGHYFIRLSLPNIGIHGTNAPSSIYQFRTHGCVRLHPDDVCALFGEVSVGDTGVVVYEPALLARLADGRVFAEVHRDVYRRAPAALPFLRAMADHAGLATAIDWDQVAIVVRDRDGLAVDVTRKVAGPPPARTR
jgi:hypothetical protein